MPHLRTAFCQLLEPLDRRDYRARGRHAWRRSRCGRRRAGLDLRAPFKEFAVCLSGRVDQSARDRSGVGRRNERGDFTTSVCARRVVRRWPRPMPTYGGGVSRHCNGALIPVAARAVLHETAKALIRLLDAMPIPLKLARAWAEAEQSARTRGLKLHLSCDPHSGRVAWFDLTSAKIDDVVAGRAMPLEPGVTYVFDKGYNDFIGGSDNPCRQRFLCHPTQAQHAIVARLSNQTAGRAHGVLADRRLKIGHRRPRGGAPINPLWEVELREDCRRPPRPRRSRSTCSPTISSARPSISRGSSTRSAGTSN